MEQQVFSADECLSAARGTEFQNGAAGTTSGATATEAAAAGVIHKVTWATFFTDADSILQILDGTTVIWEIKIDVSAEGWSRHCPFPTPLAGTRGNKIDVKIISSSADCYVSFGGFSTKSQ